MHQRDVASLDDLLDIEVEASLDGGTRGQFRSQALLTFRNFAGLLQEDGFWVV